MSNGQVTKRELLDQISEQLDDTTRKEVAEFLDAFVETVKQNVAAGDDVLLTGFGRFSTARRPARAGRDPRTGEPLQIPASTRPVFRPGKAFKEAIRR